MSKTIYAQNANLVFAKGHTAGSIIIVGIVFTAFLILSNLTAFKIVAIGQFAFPAGFIFFPLTYIFDDILTEVYGFKLSRRVIWSALLANVIIVLGTSLTIYLKPAPYWHEQAAYATVYHAIPRVFCASLIGYLSGEFTNSIILSKLKVMSKGRHLWLRLIVSTAVGVLVDTLLFVHVAFLFTIDYHRIWHIILTMYVFKVSYEVCAMPLTYKLTNYLKQRDKVDHYDHQTVYNPFSISLD